MRVVFLDRDGVINKDPAGKMYVTKWKDFSFLPRAKRAVCLLCKNGFKVVLISNQAGVGKGLFSKKKLAFITDNMQKALKKSGGRVHGVFYCTHRSEDDCNCRKPKAGLIHMATKRFPCDLTKTYFIGDTIRDVMAARQAGCRSILIFTGKEKPSNKKNWETQPKHTFSDLYEAVEFIVGKK